VWSMAALRLGFCVAPPWVGEELEKVVLPDHQAVPTQLAGVLALRYGAEMDERVGVLVEERERLRAQLDAVGGVTALPSGANFVLLRVHDNGHALWQRLVERGVLVRDYCLRVTVGTPEENDAFLAALRAALQEVPAA
jgi:histidinol-phosphate aminotransferase